MVEVLLWSLTIKKNGIIGEDMWVLVFLTMWVLVFDIINSSYVLVFDIIGNRYMVMVFIMSHVCK